MAICLRLFIDWLRAARSRIIATAGRNSANSTASSASSTSRWNRVNAGRAVMERSPAWRGAVGDVHGHVACGSPPNKLCASSFALQRLQRLELRAQYGAAVAAEPL